MFILFMSRRPCALSDGVVLAGVCIEVRAAFYWLLDFQWWSIKVVHMVGVKPWKCSRFRDCGGFPGTRTLECWCG
jgi:hypothetical protein